MLADIDTVTGLLGSKRQLILAGDETVLRQLPGGNWIGGTIPYFMTTEGGTVRRDRIFVTEVPRNRSLCSLHDVRRGKHPRWIWWTVRSTATPS